MSASTTRVVVVGDGPSGSALAAELVDRLGADAVLLIGLDRPWTATYGAWSDDLDGLGGRVGEVSLVATEVAGVRVATTHDPDDDRLLDRGYAVVDNDRLRSTVRAGVDHRVGLVAAVRVGPGGRRTVVVGAETVDADLVVDATGWPRRFPEAPDRRAMGWQSAWGVVLAEPPPGPLGRPTVMDWSPPGGVDHAVPTFAYALPVHDGWLVEETVLAADPAVEPDELRPVLARRLGLSPDRLDALAVRLERVRIPMGTPIPARRRPAAAAPVVAFGAAAGLAHPATGYQLLPALRAAPRVADAIASNLDDGAAALDRAVGEAVWPSSRRRTRRLHEFGLDVLLGLDADGVRRFFTSFFALPDDVWPAQMRIESSPAQVASLMTRMFAAAPWSLRRQLVGGDVGRLARVVRP